MKVKQEDSIFQYRYQQPIRLYWLKRLSYPICNLFLHILTRIIPNKKRTNRFYFSLVLIFKDEAPFLKEWIEYHLILGVDHFYLYNNNSSDHYLTVIQPYMDRDIITLVDWPEYPGQYSAYLHWYQSYRQETQWASFIDADEFLCPILEVSLRDVMKRYEKYPVILAYWKLFGTNGQLMHDDNRLIIEQYTHCRPKLFSEGKIIYNTRFDAASDFISMHGLETKWHGIKIPPLNTFGKFVIWDFHSAGRHAKAVLQINHYWSKAYNCWENKYEKGSIEKGTKYKDFNFFKNLELACTSTDKTIWRYLTLLKIKLKEQENLNNFITNK